MEKEDKVPEVLPEEDGSAESGEEVGAGTGFEAEGDLAAALGQAREEAREAQDKLLRLAAEFENQKKRLHRDKEVSLKYAEENLIREILPAVDNLERALGQDRSGEDFSRHLLEGVELTLRGLMNALEKFGLTPLTSVGEPFDPNFHEALAMEVSKDVPEQRIMQEYEKGYMLKDRLLRAAKVVVSKGKGED